MPLFVLEAASGQVPTRNPAWAQKETRYDEPFFKSADYDPNVPTPGKILGFRLGSRPARVAQVERCLRTWERSPRLTLHDYGRTHEQRTLYYAVITSAKNHARLAQIRAAIGKLADPRKLRDDAEAQRIIRDTPAIAWLGYSIHGDELSGVDASLAVMHLLVAGRDPDVQSLLDELVIIVDPHLNPDGRERIIGILDQARGYTPNLDTSAVQHGGRWPYGRGNHYLFDLNRDWILGVHPETRGRQKAVAAWHPQLLVDAHEMGSHDTFLFNPPREPFNPHLSAVIRKWWQTFADDQAQAFDRYGWSYYTREWLEFWYPGYSDSWACYHGALGILYEQASTGGSPIRQDTGSILTYREAVHHQAVSSIANLRSLQANRQAILADYLEQKRAALSGDSPAGRTFLLPPGDNPTRRRAFLSGLQDQGIEIGVATERFVARNLTGVFREKHESREFPAGTVVIDHRQPLGPLVGAVLDFDPRVSDKFLASERKELETKRQSRVYDVTGWSLPMAYGLVCYWSKDAPSAAVKPYVRPQPIRSTLKAAQPAYAYVIDGADDSSFVALASLLQAGVKVRVADKPFRSAGRTFPRGSLLIRRHENAPDVGDRVASLLADVDGVTIHAVQTARSPDDGPDLGGGHFTLLQRPRAALFGGASVSFTSYGAIWRLFDVDVGLAVSLFDTAGGFGRDLRKYNVIILPSTWGPAKQAYGDMLDDLKTWVKAGGTLIAVGGSAAWLADEKQEISKVRRRRNVLDKLDVYAAAVARERAAGKVPVDPAHVWENPVESQPASAPSDDKPDTKAEDLDQWRRLFSPTGVILRGELDSEHWLTFGCPEQMPLHAAGSNVFMSKHPVRTPVRLSEAEKLRLSGLLWPEAAARLAGSAYATVERVGNGQIILFANEPDFRGGWHGSRRLLINAALLGPGFGTSQPSP